MPRGERGGGSCDIKCANIEGKRRKKNRRQKGEGGTATGMGSISRA